MKMKQFTSLEGVRFAVDRYNIDFLKGVNDNVCVVEYTVAEAPFSEHVNGGFDELLQMINDDEWKDDEGEEWKNEDR